MAKRLSEDEIKWILTLDASKAEQEMHKLNQQSAQCADRNKQLKQILTQLEAAGKKDSDQYRKLTEEMKLNKEAISKNRVEMTKLTQQMGLDNLSMSQLKSHAKDLQKQLDYTSKSLHPDEWNKLNVELAQTRAKMDNLTLSGKKVSSMMKTSFAGFNAFNVLGTVFGNYGMVWFDRFIGKMKTFASEAASLAVKSDGIRKAFKKIDEPGILDNLRKSVHGTLSDVQIMQKANLAHTFGIPMQDLAKYLQFVHMRANQTGKDFNELADAIITGIGKQSTKRLAMLGINVNSLKKNVADSGNFILGLNKEIDSQMQKSGGDYISMADGAKKRTADLLNEQEKLGEQLVPIKAQYVVFMQKLMIWSAQLMIWVAEHKKGLLVIAGALGLVTIAYTGYRLAVMAHNMIQTYHNVLVGIGNRLLAIRTIYTNASAAASKLLALRTTESTIAERAFATTAASSSVIGRALTAMMLLLRAAVLALTGQFTAAKEAMIAFNAVSKLNPWVLLATAIIAVGAAVIYFATRTKELTLAQKEAAKVNTDINEKYAEERARIELLSKTVHNSRIPYQERYNALMELKKIAPGYQATLTREGKLINDNTVALSNYLKQLKQKIILEAAKDELKTLYKDQMIQQQRYELYKKMYKYRRDQEDKTAPLQGSTMMGYASYHSTTETDHSQSNAYMDVINETKDKMDQTGAAINQFEKWQVNALRQINGMTGSVGTQAAEGASGDISGFNTKNTKKTKKTKSGSEDPNQIALQNLQSAHEAELNEIRDNGKKKEKLEQDINISIANSDIEYYNRRIQKLESFLANTKDKKKKAEYNKDIVESKKKQAEAEDAIDTNRLALAQKHRDEDLQKIVAYQEEKKANIDKDFSEGKISQDQNDKLLLALDSTTADQRLQVQRNYLNEVNNLELSNGKKKADAVSAANLEVLKADAASAKARADLIKSYQNNYQEVITGMQHKGKGNNEEDDYKLQQIALDASYQSGKEYLKEYNNKAKETGAPQMSQSELDAAYYNASEKLSEDHAKKKLEIEQKYGIQEYGKVLQQQLNEINKYQQQGILTEQEAQAQKLAIAAESYKQQAQYYSNLFSNAFQAMQQAEMDEVDAKYDVEIAAAKGNTEQTEKLENEKEAKKLAIQKKYADINFAVKCSQIIADTAVSIMKAFADLGPIGGAISAALLTVTGLMQLKSAKAERDKVKHMTVGGSSSGNTISRVATGRESGGSILVEREQDGKMFNAKYDPSKRGFVDQPTVIVGEGKNPREWIASNDAVMNPTVAPYLSLLDQSQQAGNIRTLDFNAEVRKMSGRESGGSITPGTSIPSGSNTDNGDLQKSLNRLNDTLSNGIHSTVVLTQLEEAQELRNKSRNIGSK